MLKNLTITLPAWVTTSLPCQFLATFYLHNPEFHIKLSNQLTPFSPAVFYFKKAQMTISTFCNDIPVRKFYIYTLTNLNKTKLYKKTWEAKLQCLPSNRAGWHHSWYFQTGISILWSIYHTQSCEFWSLNQLLFFYNNKKNASLTVKAHLEVCNTFSYSIATQLGEVAVFTVLHCHWYHSLLKKASGPVIAHCCCLRSLEEINLCLKQQLLNWNWEQKSSYWKSSITIF